MPPARSPHASASAYSSKLRSAGGAHRHAGGCGALEELPAVDAPGEVLVDEVLDGGLGRDHVNLLRRR